MHSRRVPSKERSPRHDVPFRNPSRPITPRACLPLPSISCHLSHKLQAPLLPHYRRLLARLLPGPALRGPVIEVSEHQVSRPFERLERIAATAEKVGRHTKIAPGVCITGSHVDRRAVRLHRLRIPPEKVQREAHVVERGGVRRIEPGGLPESLQGLCPALEACERQAKVVIGICKLRLLTY